MKENRFKRAVSAVLITAALSSMFVSAPVSEAAKPVRPEPDLNGYSKEATYNINVLPEDRQEIYDWGICVDQGEYYRRLLRGSDKEASYSSAVNDLGITMFRIGMPSPDSYNKNKELDETYMQMYLNRAIRPPVESGITKYMISCWESPTWMRSKDARGWNLLLDEYLDDQVEWIIKVIDYITDHGYPAPYCYSIQNEPRDPSTNISGEQMKKLSIKTRKAFDENGYADIKIVNPEGAAIEQQISTFGDKYERFRKSPEWADSVDIFAHHSYAMGFDRLDVLKEYIEFMDEYPDKERWQTEFSGGTGKGWYTENNSALDIALFRLKVFMGDIEWVGCNTWMFWMGVAESGGKLFENGELYGMGAGKLGNSGSILYGSEGDDDGVTSFREGPTYKMLKLVFNNVQPGSHVRRLTTDDPTLMNEMDYMVDLAAFDTDKGTAVIIANSDDYPKHYNLNNLKGNSATIYSINDTSIYKTETVYKNILNGTASEITVPPMSVNFVMTTYDDMAAPGIKLELNPLIIQKDGVYVSRNDEIDFTGILDENDAKLYINGKETDVTDRRFLQKIKISETPEIQMYAVDKNGNKSKKQTVKFRCEPNYAGIKLDTYNTKYNTTKCVLKGLVNADSTIYANGNTVKSGADNRFEIETELKQGENKFTVYAVDSKGNKSEEQEIDVLCDSIAPEITITNKSFVTDNQQIMITGKLSETAKLKINGSDVTARDDLTFAHTVTLNEGINKIMTEATDDYGNKGEKAVEVTFTKTENTPHLVEGEAYVRRAKGHITLDGNIDEADWKLDLTATKITEGTQNNVVKFGMLWDSKYLYIAADVTDDVWKIESKNPFQNDSVEIFLNPSNEKKAGYTSEDKQLFSAYVNDDTSKFYQNTRGEVKSAYHRNDNGYTCEIAIPWSTIGRAPSDGLKIGIDLVFDDNDAGGEVRNTCIAWWGTSSNYMDASGFGTIILTEKDNVTYKDIPYTYFDDGSKNITEPDSPAEDSKPENTGMKLLLNGAEVSGDDPVMNSKGRIMIPLQRLADAIGAVFNSEIGRKFIFTKPNGKTSYFSDEWTEININGVDGIADTPPAEMINDKIYVEAEFVGKIFEGSAIINADKTEINITGNY